MSKHFDYLFVDDSRDFFQKVAHDEAAPIVARAIARRATLQKMYAVDLNKTANVDRDIAILRSSGPVGMGLGMLKRADAYMDRVYDAGELEGEELGVLFDKVAGEAIHADIEAARQHLYSLATEAERPWVDAELAKVAAELVYAAQVEKQAGRFSAIGELAHGLGPISGARTLTRAGAEAAGAGARSLGGALKGVAGETASTIGQGAAAPFRAAKRLGGKAMEEFRGLRANRAARKLENIEGALGAAKARPGAAAAGAAKSFEGQQASAAASLAKKQEAIAPKVPNAAKPLAEPAAKGPAATAAPPSKTTAPAGPPAAKAEELGKAKAVETETSRARGAEGAAEAAKAPEGAGADGGVKLKDAFAKMRDGGWKSLSPAERQKLISAGALGLVGGRVVTGHGVVTGGEGLV